MENRNDQLMDFLNILGFVVGLENLSMNISQTDLQEETNRLDKKVDEKIRAALEEIHEHLQLQDKKINMCLDGINQILNNFDLYWKLKSGNYDIDLSDES